MVRSGGNGRFGPPGEGYDNPQDDFPLRDTYTDCTGRERVFEVSCHDAALGYRVTAQELGVGGFGYEFAAFDSSSPYLALGTLRDKIYRALCTRHIKKTGDQYVPTHDLIRGRITSSDGQAAFVIDGEPLNLDELGRLLSVNEGWDFELRLLDPC